MTVGCGSYAVQPLGSTLGAWHPCSGDPVDSTPVMLLYMAGTFAFAISGALVAVRRRLDLFGVLVLSFAAATAGGPSG